jgi:hypothetical protein
MQNWKGSWLDDGTGLSQISYYKGETVKYENTVYIATANTIAPGSPIPPDDMSNWNTVVFGSIGPTGTAGTSGTRGTSGTSGVAGISGVDGINGIDGTNGTSGSSGSSGVSGTSGTSGSALPTGGTSGQVLAKIDSTNFNVRWVDQSGGGGGGGSGSGTPTQIVLPPKTGQILGLSVNATALITGTAAVNRLVLIPFIPNNTITSTELSINVTTAAAGSLARILIFDSVNGVPDTKLYESTSLDCSTTGIKAVSTSFTFNSGTVYWIGVHSNQAGAVYRAFGAGSLLPISYSSVGGLANVSWIVMTYALGSLPSQIDFAAVGGLAQTNTIAVWITVA